jgi:hypothetical protein
MVASLHESWVEAARIVAGQKEEKEEVRNSA